MLEYTYLWSPTNFLGKEIITENGAHVSDSFAPPGTFSYRRGRFESAAHVAEHVNDWNRRFSNFMITHAVPRDPKAATGPRQKHLFKRRPSSIAFFDLENIPYMSGLSRHDLIADPERIIREQLFHLDPMLEEVEWSFVLSSKAGLADDFRGHLYLQLDAIYEPEAITEWITERKSPYTDLSVYDDGHAIIVESPRIIGMEDPFKKRAFVNRGGAMQPSVKDYSGHVRGTVLRQRTSNRLPVLGDIILSGEHITDEVVKKYLPRLRGAIGHVEWDEARPYLEAELQRMDAPPSVYRRLKGDTAKFKGQPLGVAQRGWESLSGGDHEETLMKPRFTEPAGDLNTEQQRLKREVRMSIGDGGTHLFRASLGMGKTEAAVVGAVKESMLGDAPVILAVPSHDRAKEVCDRLNGELTRQVDDYTDRHGQFALGGDQLKQWAAWRGREQEGMCARVPAVKAAQMAGVSVHDALCGFGQEKKCPKFESCPYAHQVEHFYSNNWVVPHAMLQHSSRLSKGAGTIMADESFIQNLKGTTTIALGELIARDSDLHDIYDILLTRAKNTQINEIEPIDKQRLEDALAIELEAREIPEIDTDWEDVDIEAVCGEATEKYRGKVVSLLRALIAEDDGGRNHVYCYKSNKEPKALVAYRKKAKFITEKHTLIMFDATPNEMAVRKFFPDVEIEDFVAPNQNLVVIQVGDRTGQVSEFIAKNTKTKEVERAKRNRARLADWVHAQPGDGILLVKKAVEEALADEHDMRVPMGHFHALEGQDVWEFDDRMVKGADVDWCAVVQRSCPPAMVPEEEAMAYFCDDVEPIARQPWNNGIPWYNTENVELAAGVGGIRYRHPDARVDGCLRAILDASQMQAIGRVRGTRREKTGVVYVLHQMALEVEVTAVVRSAMLNAMVGGVALYGAAEIERVFGYSGRWIGDYKKDGTDLPEANVRYWTEGSSNRGCKAWAVAGVDVGSVMDAIGAVRWERLAVVN